MGRKKKSFASVSDVEPVEEDINASQVEEEIESQDEARPSATSRARSILSSGINNVQDKLGTEPRQRKKWVSPAKRQEQEGNITTLVTSLIIMLVAGWKVPDELKPSEDEMTAVSGLSTSILLRHVNISGRLTQDVLDGIGIVAVVAMYITRTSSAWRVYTEAKKASEAIPAPVLERDPLIPKDIGDSILGGSNVGSALAA